MWAALGQHKYAVLGVIVFLEAIGIPIPAALALVAAGAASASRVLRPELVVLTAVSAMLLGDALLYFLGRYSGWTLLGILCRVSLNPETCILRAAESFYRRGRITLVVAKFLPGINTMAPPLAGSMRMGLGQFLRLDLAAACLYTLAFGGLGFLFSGFIGVIVHEVRAVGRVIEWLVIAGLAGYVGYRIRVYWKHRAYRMVPRVNVGELAQRLASADPEKIVLADVRSHGYYDPGASRIKGSIRLEPNNLSAQLSQLSRDKPIYLYCT